MVIVILPMIYDSECNVLIWCPKVKVSAQERSPSAGILAEIYMCTNYRLSSVLSYNQLLKFEIFLYHCVVYLQVAC